MRGRGARAIISDGMISVVLLASPSANWVASARLDNDDTLYNPSLYDFAELADLACLMRPDAVDLQFRYRTGLVAPAAAQVREYSGNICVV